MNSTGLSALPVRSRIRSKWARARLTLMSGIVMIAGFAVPTLSVAEAAAPTAISGWRLDFVDNFNGSLNTAVWGRYGGGGPTARSLSSYDSANIYTAAGSMVLRTHRVNGVWTSGGVSAGRGFSAKQGKWAFRARFERAYGVGFAFLLFPKGGGWPPEVDMAEGTAGGPRVMSVLHYDADDKQKIFFRYGVDMTKWHTYGAILKGTKLSFTIDGVVTNSFTTAGVPNIPMWFAVQAGAKNCAVSTGECTTSSTPLDSHIYIDWVAHYAAA